MFITSFTFSYWIFHTVNFIITNHQATDSPTYWRMVGAYVLVVRVFVESRDFQCSGKVFILSNYLSTRVHEAPNGC